MQQTSTETHQHYAEIRFVGRQANLQGAVVAMTSASATVQAQDAQMAHQLATAGAQGVIFIATGTALYVSQARVAGVKEGRVEMAFAQPLRKLERRETPRFSCELEVSFRAIHPDGHTGLWQEAMTTDVSVNGMRLRLAPDAQMIRSIQAIFSLPKQNMQELQSKLVSEEGKKLWETKQAMSSAYVAPKDDESELDKPIRVTARVVHSRPEPEGCFSVGMAFTQIKPYDQIRLAHLTGADNIAA
jgi:hypothetical protein